MNKLTVFALSLLAAAAALTGTAARASCAPTLIIGESSSSRLPATPNVAITGRAHSFDIVAVKDDGAGNCVVDTDYTDNSGLFLWVENVSGLWPAPSLSWFNGSSTRTSTALTSHPDFENVFIAFTNGVGSVSLQTPAGGGKFVIHVEDANGNWFPQTSSAQTPPITVRPLAIIVTGISKDGVTQPNPQGSAATDSVFVKSGDAFQVRVQAIQWSQALDADNDGVLDAGVTSTQVLAAAGDNSFNYPVTLTPSVGSQTPAAGMLGTLSNAMFADFTVGMKVRSDVSYSEAGSFAIETHGVVQNYLGTAGLNLDLAVFGFAPDATQNARVGRFIPAGFALSSASYKLRSDQSCATISTFDYLGEPMRSTVTVKAVNTQGAVTANYIGAFAKLDMSSSSTLGLAGLAGALPLTTGGRIAFKTLSGSFVAGVATAKLDFTPTRGSALDAPMNAIFSIAPLDSDGVTLMPNSGNLGSAELRTGYLRLASYGGSEVRDAAMPLEAKFWNGAAWMTNTDDNCTTVPASAVNFKGYTKSLSAASTNVAGPVTLQAGVGRLIVRKPPAGVYGGADVALSLGSSTAVSWCAAWTPGAGDAATAGASLDYLRGANCGASPTALSYDPSARLTFGIYRSSDQVITIRETY